MKMEEGHMLKKRINETGSEIIISISPKDELILEILNLKSFNEFTRIMVYMKTMLYMYQITLTGDERYKIFFTKKSLKTIQFFEKEEEENMEQTTDEEELMDFCRKNLAGFKRPKQIVFCEIPKTATGKLQKFELRKKIQ